MESFTPSASEIIGARRQQTLIGSPLMRKGTPLLRYPSRFPKELSAARQKSRRMKNKCRNRVEKGEFKDIKPKHNRAVSMSDRISPIQ